MLRRLDGLIATLVLVALAIGAVSVRREPERLAGDVRVVDGDTIELGGRRLRIAGIDAPELRQTCERGGELYRCGETAREELRRLAGPGLTCRVAGRDRYARDLAVCEAGGRDVGAALVSAGLATAYGRYEAEEREARRRRLGLWAGTFQRPAEWREAHPR
ncbi:thermonuclease family protein [Enterovirga aerilata]|uniref:Thermonuclease family protein n=1 Tax=Enterovirga aerilata TaxID=2730920 RepID=A0A849IDP6_9HYPH|nr:thermonuclease family protein [Enterovirga sp. DB1703]NNM72023.1 thermonuclease family protein [Enterovirga sp. DB1703]